MCVDWKHRMTSDHAVEAKIATLLAQESEQYLVALNAWRQEKKNMAIVRRDEGAWSSLVNRVEENDLWQMHNFLRQIEASLIASLEVSEQAKKNYPYAEEQLFLEWLVHEKKKSRREVSDLLRHVQNRIWEEIGFAPYTY